MPLNRYADDVESTEAEICEGCKFYPTKPEAVPREIAFYVATALELSELESSGGRFAYPEAVTPIEWAAIAGLARGRGRAETLKADRERRKHRREARASEAKR